MALWRLDTCRCLVEYAGSPAQLVRFHSKCEDHRELSDELAWHAVYAGPASEQRIQNTIVRPLVRGLPWLDLLTVDDSGREQLRPGAAIDCRFETVEGLRRLRLRVRLADGAEISEEQRARLQETLDQLPGIGRGHRVE